MADNNALAHAFGKQVCLGNREAEVCCHLWYHYCHFVDDLIDTKEDGRPTMTNEQILHGLMLQAQLFNCAFWKQHSSVLFGSFVAIHNMFADSVLWERSPQDHKRAMANVLRMAGDEFFCMIAMLVGGYEHMRKLSPQIRETDWLRQNAGDPTDQF